METVKGPDSKEKRIEHMISLYQLPLLRLCIMYLHDEEQAKDTIRGLKSAEGFIRRMLAKTINLRNTPELTFVLDESIEYGVTMSKLIDEVTHKEDKKDEENEEN